jgi:hypothetical protein
MIDGVPSGRVRALRQRGPTGDQGGNPWDCQNRFDLAHDDRGLLNVCDLRKGRGAQPCSVSRTGEDGAPLAQPEWRRGWSPVIAHEADSQSRAGGRRGLTGSRDEEREPSGAAELSADCQQRGANALDGTDILKTLTCRFAHNRRQTPHSQGGDTGSNPVGAASKSQVKRAFGHHHPSGAT